MRTPIQTSVGTWKVSLTIIIPENEPYYVHTFEGPDDMPAHAKASLMGASLMLPVQNGQLALGTWQGIYLNEHRNHGGPRKAHHHRHGYAFLIFCGSHYGIGVMVQYTAVFLLGINPYF
jgi:hypothetical protein